jgi:UDP-glucose 4-epimerase
MRTICSTFWQHLLQAPDTSPPGHCWPNLEAFGGCGVRETVGVGITIAITGPTGEIGVSAVAALERAAGVDRIVGMARRPFDPGALGWTKTQYHQGDILDRAAVDALVGDADVVVHLAFVVMGSREESRRVNLAGTRNVFEATVAASRPRRLVYTSSVAAYGYHYENPTPLTEDVPTRGSSEHYYSQQKAQCEALLSEVTIGSDLDVYVLRPCIVAGPKATALADSMPWNQIGERPAELLRAASRVSPLMRPVLPDLGIRQQLAHARWGGVAQLACSAASMSSAIEAEIPSASTEMSGTVS